MKPFHFRVGLWPSWPCLFDADSRFGTRPMPQPRAAAQTHLGCQHFNIGARLAATSKHQHGVGQHSSPVMDIYDSQDA